ncbi:MAG TPA: hypothetical protein VMG58_09430, partial [Candidatus Sulfotelmatobacter sp.]|nr:hypothetical protein [Candidatus Sulfotelmatobacter sp.]
KHQPRSGTAPTVSLVVPCYSLADFLGGRLKSILPQTSETSRFGRLLAGRHPSGRNSSRLA